jgi:hypothetical protein
MLSGFCYSISFFLLRYADKKESPTTNESVSNTPTNLSTAEQKKIGCSRTRAKREGGSNV